MDDIKVSQTHKTKSVDKSVWRYFVECITKKYVCFKGRARRKEYFGFLLVDTLVRIFIAVSLVRLQPLDDFINLLWSLFLFLPGLGVLVRRLHDVGYSAWWIAATLMPVISNIAFFTVNLVFYDGNTADYLSVLQNICFILASIPTFVIVVVIFFKSDMKKNKYGDVPEGVA